MDELPRRERLTDDTAVDTPLRPLLHRVDKFVDTHPGFRIVPPYNTIAGKLWEVHIGDSPRTQWDNPYRMMDYLEEAYPRERRQPRHHHSR